MISWIKRKFFGKKEPIKPKQTEYEYYNNYQNYDYINDYINDYRSKSDKLEKELIEIMTSVGDDWTKNRYKDKVEFSKDAYGTVLIYKKENGCIIKINNNKKLLIIENNTQIKYTLTQSFANSVIKIFNTIVDQINNGNIDERKKINTKQTQYNTLLDTIKRRKEHLKGLNNNDPDRISLELELNIAVKKAENMKIKHNLK